MKSSFLYFFCILLVDLSAQQQFTNFGNLMSHGDASLSVFGDFENNGNFADSGSAIILSGVNAQRLGGSSLTTVKNLELNNSSGSYLSSHMNLQRELKITAGTFSTTGFNFTLLSNQQGTARIAPIAGDFAGNITMQRYLPSGSTGWRFLSSPVSGCTINDWQDNFITSGFPGSTYPTFNFTSVYTYDESVPGNLDLGYQSPSSAGDTIRTKHGYWCYIGPVPLTIDLTGAPQKFNQTFPVSYNASGNSSDDGWIMIGNPYPSSIDWNSTAWNKTNINSAIYIWNSNLQQYASYVSGSGVNGGSNIVASSQSFWVQTNGPSPVLSCSEQVKVSGDQPFLKSGGAVNRLSITISGNNFSDEADLSFDPSANNGYDVSQDARKVYSWNPQVPSICTLDSLHSELSINALRNLNEKISVPVKTMVGVSGTYTITIDTSEFNSRNICLEFEDLYTGSRYGIGQSSSYTFQISDTTRAPRFLIHMTALPLVNSAPSSCHNQPDGTAIVKAYGKGPWHYEWLNSSQQTIRTIKSGFSSDTLRAVAAGHYLLNVKTFNSACAVQSLSVQIGGPSPLVALFGLSKDTIHAGDSVAIHNISPGQGVTYHWSFGDGTDTTAQHPGFHRYQVAGLYRLKLTAGNYSCQDSSLKFVLVKDKLSTGSDENEPYKKMRVYPNPGKGRFYFEDRPFKSEKGFVRIFSNTGALIKQIELEPGSNFAVDLTGEANGLYIYEMQTENGATAFGKLVIH